MKDKVYWLENSPMDEVLDTTTWYRSVGIEEFVKKVEAENKICGVIFSDNNIGFVLKKK